MIMLCSILYLFRIEETMKMKHKDINKLRFLTLTLSTISVPLKVLPKVEELSIYRVEIWLENSIIDETGDIIATVNKKDQTLVLSIGSGDFKYSTSDLFATHKVARLMVKVLRSWIFTSQQQILDQYHVVLSQYSYEYSNQKKTNFQQHSVGLYKRSFLYYTLHCSYKKMENKENEVLKNMPLLKRNTYNLYESGSSNEFSPLFRRDKGVLPIDSIEKLDLDLFSEEESRNTYIQKKSLRPVYLSDRNPEAKIKIHLEHSFVNFEPERYREQSSVMLEHQKIGQGLDIVQNILFKVFMIASLIRIIFLIIPTPKV